MIALLAGVMSYVIVFFAFISDCVLKLLSSLRNLCNYVIKKWMKELITIQTGQLKTFI